MALNTWSACCWIASHRYKTNGIGRLVAASDPMKAKIRTQGKGTFAMLKYALAYVSTAVIFFILDFIWLSSMATNFYRARLPDIMAADVNYPAAVLFYLMYVAGVVIFAVTPALESGRWTTAAIYGALFGVMAYGTYDLTSQATLKQWSTAVTVVDMAWGTFVSASAASLSYLATKLLLSRFH